MIIALSGKSGSGKSSTAKLIAKKLKLDYYSIGKLQRDFAKAKDITLEELRRLESIDPKIDEEFDNFQISLGDTEDNFIIDSRLSPYLIKKSIKIFLDCDDDTRAQRILNDSSNSNRLVELKNSTKESILKRDSEDRKRLYKQSGFDFLDLNNYDIIIDSSNISIEDTANLIIEKIKNYI